MTHGWRQVHALPYSRSMELQDTIRTTFAARDFTDEELTDETLYDILDVARFAPSGGNRQGWKVLVIRSQETRRQLADLCMPTVRRYVAEMRAGESPWNTVVPSSVTDEEAEATEVAWPMLDEIDKVQVVLVVAVDLSVLACFDKDLERVGIIGGASIYPFVWNILLAARDRGYGGTITTFLTGQEPAAREVLGLPENYAVAALVPLGRPVKQLTKLRRNPVEEFACFDRWDGDPLVR
ncbi:MAG: nitroreductase family protein [Acidobacteriota bacterium]